MTLTINPITMNIDGIQYEAELAKVVATNLGFEDHGIFSATIYCSGVTGSWTQSYGPVCISDATEDFVRAMLAVFEVRAWEQIRNKEVYVLRKGSFIEGFVSKTHKHHFVSQGFWDKWGQEYL